MPKTTEPATNQTLKSSVASIPRIGDAMAKRLKRLNIATIRDLLFTFPLRYDDLRSITPLDKVAVDAHQTVRATVELLANKRSPRKGMTITEALISDASGQIKVIWFQQPYLAKVLTPGKTFLFSGKVVNDRYGLYLSNPSYEMDKAETLHAGRIVPQYALTAGLTQKQLRFFIKLALPFCQHLHEWLPEELLRRHAFMNIQDAVRTIHFPNDHGQLQQARQRLKFDELFFLQLKSQHLARQRKVANAPKIAFDQTVIQKLIRRLPFQLTDDQKKAAWQLLKDLEKPHPMNRLLEGDVGSGKTVVAAIAAFQTISTGHQAVVLAPTEVLAMQHFQSLSRLLEGFKSRIGLLTHAYCHRSPEEPPNASLPASSRRKLFLDDLLLGSIDLVIGTHALLEEGVLFAKLGLAIIDEQHRFGVRQRKILTAKSGLTNAQPHLLSMTATPIPRSLALTVYGDLHISIIRQKPTGRKPILTSIVTGHERHNAYTFIDQQISDGRQAFVICPLVNESDLLGFKSVTQEAKRLQTDVFPHRRIAILHGKMKAAEKEKIMAEFLDRKFHLLVATSVIEVGIDVSNATVMIIEDAERFGLAQLHQFRGRVGRSEHQSYCFAFTEHAYGDARERLRAFASTEDGFALAEKDLEMRGPGEVYGTQQSGLPLMKIATLADLELIALAEQEVIALFETDPELLNAPLLKRHLEKWISEIHLE